MRGELLVVGDVANVTEAVDGVLKLRKPVTGVIIAGNVENPEKALLTQAPFPIYCTQEIKGCFQVPLETIFGISGLRMAFSKDPSALMGSKGPIDVLVSSQPKLVGVDGGSEKVSQLGSRLSPKYHFYSGPKYYHSEAFCAPYGTVEVVSLTSYSSESGWYEAIDQRPPQDVSGVNLYTGDALVSDVGWVGESHNQRPMKRTRTCFMCLDSSTASRDLILEELEDVYICVAKGGLRIPVVEERFGIGGHVLIIPKAHIRTTLLLGCCGDLGTVFSRLHSLYTSSSLSFLHFELVRSRGQHGHIQVVPIPVEVVEKCREYLHSKLTPAPPATGDRDELLIGFGPEKSTRIPLPPRSDVQWTRQLVCEFFDLQGQSSWKDCVSETDEVNQVRELKRRLALTTEQAI